MTGHGVRRFTRDGVLHWQQMGDQNIQLAHAIEQRDGALLSAYYARLGKGVTAPLPASYSEVWVVLEGTVTVTTGETTLSADAGDFLYVPENSPGEVTANTDVLLVSVSVPPH